MIAKLSLAWQENANQEEEKAMKKHISCLVLGCLFMTGSAYASGYRIPEQSVDSVAKSGADIASADKADAAYFNPANMTSFSNAWQVEVDATYLHLTSVDYSDNRSSRYNGSSEQENYFLPTFFAVSPDYNNFRIGLSLTAPFGLAKRWDDAFPKTFAEKFALKVYEFNPTVAYKINDIVSIAGGVRMLYSEATVMSSGVVSPADGYTAARYVNGDTTEWGYNLAIDVKPAKDWNLAVTYRSKVDLDFDGDVKLMTNTGSPVTTQGDVSIPAPAVLAFSAAYTVDAWTFELTLDETFWSAYETLDFNYNTTIYNPVLKAAFDAPVTKSWDDSTAIRLGVEYVVDPRVTILAGFAYDQNPIPDKSLGFDLPDSDALLFSLGCRFKIDDRMEVGYAALYDYKVDRDVVNSKLNGSFSGSAALLMTLGLSYKF